MKEFLYLLANFITILDYLATKKIENDGLFDQYFDNITNELAEMAKDIGIPTKEKKVLLKK